MTRVPSRAVFACIMLLGTSFFVGCKTGNPFAAMAKLASLNSSADTSATIDYLGHQARRRYSRSLDLLANDPALIETVAIAKAAEKAQRESDPSCTQLYAKVALDCWPRLTPPDSHQDDELAAAVWQVYHHSVASFVANAALHNQLDPGRGVSLTPDNDDGEYIPVTHHGFPWAAEDFNELRLPGVNSGSGPRRYWSETGLGIPLVAIRKRESREGYLSPQLPFSATCILRPGDATDSRTNTVSAVLELHDPLRVQQANYRQQQWQLARDLSAPLVTADRDIEIDRNKFASFMDLESAGTTASLRMIEPYQPGKIPIVFIHGLLSDRFTWLDLVNDLRSVEGLMDQYQLWSFQYPTGQPFLRSAAELRHHLAQIVQELDPDGNDPAMSNMVLVGHSMGGLIAKSQVSYSDSMIWDSVASRRIEEINVSQEIQQEIEQVFFFEPSPHIKRVVFIGSPHRGSRMAKSVVGKIGSALVHAPNDRETRFQRIVADNPDLFVGDLSQRLPSSIDLLRPDNPMLLANYKLRVNPQVQLHNIIGTGDPLAGGIPADGVVAVESAKHPGTVSEHHIDTTHTDLTGHEETTTELVRILGQHLRGIPTVEKIAVESASKNR